MQGTENLNRMREVIKSVLGTLGSELNKQTEDFPLAYRGQGNLMWTVPALERPGLVQIYCYAGPDLICSRFGKEAAVEDVQRVYESLEKLLESILAEFPEIAESLKPVFAAAKI